MRFVPGTLSPWMTSVYYIFEEIEEVVRDDDTATNTDNNFVLEYDSNTGCSLQVRPVDQMRVLSVRAYLNLPTYSSFFFKRRENKSVWNVE